MFMGSEITICAKEHSGETPLLYQSSDTEIKNTLGVLKHIMYSFALERYPYNHYKRIYIVSKYKKIGKIKREHDTIIVIIPSYHVDFLNMIEVPFGGVCCRKEAFDDHWVLRSHDVDRIVFTKVDSE